jgi:peptide/nickel transport system ATP-binding protein
MSESVLVVEDLCVRVGGVTAIEDLSFELETGQRTGLIGESGSGKTLTALAIMGLLPEGISATGRVMYRDRDLLAMSENDLCRLRGDRLAMIFQEPATALNPVMRVGEQVAEPLRLKRGLGRREAQLAARELLQRVRLPDPDSLLRAYPHQLSGGQRQRVMIAIAMACSPDVLLADEPTTALDVTIQAQILDLIGALVDEEGATLLLITHDLVVVDNLCQRVLVLYGGRLVEHGTVEAVFGQPRHPYTRALLDAIPPIDRELPGRKLPAIPGSVPGLGQFPPGCPFRNRCPRADARCAEMPPLEATPTAESHAVACWHPLAG